MLVGSIICIVIGLICLICGYLIWKKQKLSLIHEYHWKNVRKEDIPAYARRVGLGLVIFGCGGLITGVAMPFSDTAIVWAPLFVGSIIGVIMLISSEKF